jgi:hypothetical protein
VSGQRDGEKRDDTGDQTDEQEVAILMEDLHPIGEDKARDVRLAPAHPSAPAPRMIERG